MKKSSNLFLIILVVFILFPAILITYAGTAESVDIAIADYKAMVKGDPESVEEIGRASCRERV